MKPEPPPRANRQRSTELADQQLVALKLERVRSSKEDLAPMEERKVTEGSPVFALEGDALDDRAKSKLERIRKHGERKEELRAATVDPHELHLPDSPPGATWVLPSASLLEQRQEATPTAGAHDPRSAASSGIGVDEYEPSSRACSGANLRRWSFASEGSGIAVDEYSPCSRAHSGPKLRRASRSFDEAQSRGFRLGARISRTGAHRHRHSNGAESNDSYASIESAAIGLDFSQTLRGAPELQDLREVSRMAEEEGQSSRSGRSTPRSPTSVSISKVVAVFEEYNRDQIGTDAASFRQCGSPEVSYPPAPLLGDSSSARAAPMGGRDPHEALAAAAKAGECSPEALLAVKRAEEAAQAASDLAAEALAALRATAPRHWEDGSAQASQVAVRGDEGVRWAQVAQPRSQPRRPDQCWGFDLLGSLCNVRNPKVEGVPKW